MKQLYRYIIDPSKLSEFLQYTLDISNTLSELVFKNIQKKEGTFFSIFRKKVTQEQLYGFRFGGVGGNIRDELSELVFEELKQNPEFVCIFDSIDETYDSSYDEWSFYRKAGVHFKDEVYYIIKASAATKDLIRESFYTSDAIWHSLCILSKISPSYSVNRELSEEHLVNFVKNAHFIFIGAYDEEGFVYWERKKIAVPQPSVPQLITSLHG